jgi:hypothetical protein
MTWLEKLFLLIGAIAVLMALKPWPRRGNVNPPPTARKPHIPPYPIPAGRVPKPGEWPEPPPSRLVREDRAAPRPQFSTAPRRERAAMDEMTITRPQLREAMRQWEQDFRDGKTLTVEEAAAMTVDQVADENAEHVWDKLQTQQVAA